MASPNRFLDQARTALEDPHLQDAYRGATERFLSSRARAFADFPEGESLRDRARSIKERTLAELDRHLSRLADSVERVGGRAHWASDAAEAQEIVIGIAREHGASRIVKSKSMTTEEIHLNRALDQAGISAVETDLGEYILQLAGETPSHIIAPAIHKTKDDVAALFAAKLGAPRLREHAELTALARDRLRDTFQRAQIGVTGANFAVAETGTVVIVENEGNARLTTTLPRVHVAVMGMEKVIPDLASLSVFLRILARSATGQKMSSYVSLLTGPRREGEEDGPEAFHLIVLDNGRSGLLAEPRLREALYCIRCGACLNACPVYRHAGGHAYGSVYSGPIGSVITPSLVGHDRARPLPFASSLCGACREVCPVRIDIPRLLIEQRTRVVGGEPGRAAAVRGGARMLERASIRLFTFVMSSESRYRMVSRLVSWLLRPWVREGRIPRLPGLSRWCRARDFPAPARPTFRERWEVTHRGSGTS